MKLVGATDWFIRWPFVIERMIVGAAGSLMAIAMLAVTKFADCRATAARTAPHDSRHSKWTVPPGCAESG